MADGKGLSLQIAPSGSGLWRLEHRFLGKEEPIGRVNRHERAVQAIRLRHRRQKDP